VSCKSLCISPNSFKIVEESEFLRRFQSVRHQRPPDTRKMNTCNSRVRSWLRISKIRIASLLILGKYRSHYHSSEHRTTGIGSSSVRKSRVVVNLFPNATEINYIVKRSGEIVYPPGPILVKSSLSAIISGARGAFAELGVFIDVGA
jgi:hypothetical protein